jgi:hypothetical protein
MKITNLFVLISIFPFGFQVPVDAAYLGVTNCYGIVNKISLFQRKAIVNPNERIPLYISPASRSKTTALLPQGTPLIVLRHYSTNTMDAVSYFQVQLSGSQTTGWVLARHIQKVCR